MKAAPITTTVCPAPQVFVTPDTRQPEGWILFSGLLLILWIAALVRAHFLKQQLAQKEGELEDERQRLISAFSQPSPVSRTFPRMEEDEDEETIDAVRVEPPEDKRQQLETALHGLGYDKTEIKERLSALPNLDKPIDQLLTDVFKREKTPATPPGYSASACMQRTK